VPKPFLGHPQYFPPPTKSIFFQEQEISQEREFVASQFGNCKKMFLIMQNYLEGQSLCSPHSTPQIQCLPNHHPCTLSTIQYWFKRRSALSIPLGDPDRGTDEAAISLV
jgi:hypothetical protein